MESLFSFLHHHLGDSSLSSWLSACNPLTSFAVASRAVSTASRLAHGARYCHHIRRKASHRSSRGRNKGTGGQAGFIPQPLLASSAVLGISLPSGFAETDPSPNWESPPLFCGNVVRSCSRAAEKGATATCATEPILSGRAPLGLIEPFSLWLQLGIFLVYDHRRKFLVKAIMTGLTPG